MKTFERQNTLYNSRYRELFTCEIVSYAEKIL